MRRAAATATVASPNRDGMAGAISRAKLSCCISNKASAIPFSSHATRRCRPNAALPAERGARVIFEVPKPLIRLFATLAGPEQVIAEGDELPHFDWHVPLLSLPLAFGTTIESVPSPGPYLHAPAAPVSGIGLCWAGNRGYANDHNRSLPLALLRPLLDIPDTRFLSLQKNLREGDEDLLRSHPNVDADSDRQGKDFADTAALVAGLDLVITVDTAVAHLAGALGRPVWVPFPPIGPGCTSATTAPGIQPRGCSASQKSAIGRAWWSKFPRLSPKGFAPREKKHEQAAAQQREHRWLWRRRDRLLDDTLL